MLGALFQWSALATLACGAQPSSPPAPTVAQQPAPPSQQIDRAALRLAVARYAAAFGAGPEESGYRFAVADWDADGREDAFVALEGPHWCDEQGCRAAVFQTVPEGVRLIADFPSLRPPFFLSWNAVSRWRDLYVWEGKGGEEPPPLERALILRFAGRGYYRYPRPRDVNFPPPLQEEGEWLELEGAPSAAIERFEGMIRLGRDLQIFRRCGEAWRWAHDATRYGLEDAFAEWQLPLHRPAYFEINATPHPHPARCGPCQRFSDSLTIFRVRRVAEAPTHCAPGPTS